MSLGVEIKLAESLSAMVNLELAYPGLLDVPVLAEIATIKTDMTTLKNSAVDTVTSKMDETNISYMLQCVSELFPIINIEDSFTNLMSAISGIADGLFYDLFTSTINAIIAMGLGSSAALLAQLEILTGFVGDKSTALINLIASLIDLDELKSILSTAMGMIASLGPGCSNLMFDKLSGLSSEILATNSTVNDVVSSVTFAKGITSDPAEMILEAKTKLVAEAGYDALVDAVNIDLVSKISILG